MKTKKNCPCGSALPYSECCEPFIKGLKNPPSAEALMRSRYSAYVEHAIDYIVETCSPDEKNKIDIRQTRIWSEKSKWLGLEILSVEKGRPEDTEGSVEFKALYEMDGLRDTHHERAKFKKYGAAAEGGAEKRGTPAKNGSPAKGAAFEESRWLYEEGSVIPKTVIRTGPKIGRNDPCPCGSGKKYKHCCAM